MERYNASESFAVIKTMIVVVLLAGCLEEAPKRGLVNDLNDLRDVNYNNPSVNQVLIWSGSQWVEGDANGSSGLSFSDLNDSVVQKVLAGSNVTVSCTGSDSNGLCTVSSSAGGFNFTQDMFDSNFNRMFASQMRISDSNLSLPTVWSAIDGNKTTSSVDLNGYMKQKNFDGNLAGRMPISDANLNIPNVWAAIDGNKVSSVDLNGYMKQQQFDGNLAGRMPISDANLNVPIIWAAIDGNKVVDTNTFTKCGDTNSYLLGTGECVPYDADAIYKPSAVLTTSGTDTNNNSLPAIYYYDNNSYTVQEASGANPLTVDVNFSDVNRLDSINMRIKYQGGVGHEIVFEVWNFTELVWEEYAEFTDMNSLSTDNITIFDSNEHISGGKVWTRFRHIQNGVPSHYFFIDWMQAVKGSTTLTNIEHDSLSGRDSTTNHPWALAKQDVNTYIDNRTVGSADFNKDYKNVSIDLNAYMTKPSFDENFNASIAGRMRIDDSNLNLSTVWSAIDGNVGGNGAFYFAGASLTLGDENKFNVNDSNLGLTFYKQADANAVLVKISDLNNAGGISYIAIYDFNGNVSILADRNDAGRFVYTVIKDFNVLVSTIADRNDSGRFLYTAINDFNGHVNQLMQGEFWTKAEFNTDQNTMRNGDVNFNSIGITSTTQGLNIAPTTEWFTEDIILIKFGRDTGAFIDDTPLELHWSNCDLGNCRLQLQTTGGTFRDLGIADLYSTNITATGTTTSTNATISNILDVTRRIRIGSSTDTNTTIIKITKSAPDVNTWLHAYDGFYNWYYGGSSATVNQGSWLHDYMQSSIIHHNTNLVRQFEVNDTSLLSISTGLVKTGIGADVNMDNDSWFYNDATDAVTMKSSGYNGTDYPALNIWNTGSSSNTRATINMYYYTGTSSYLTGKITGIGSGTDGNMVFGTNFNGSYKDFIFLDGTGTAPLINLTQGARFTGAVDQTATGIDRLDIGVQASTPRIALEDGGATTNAVWLIDNSGGKFRFYIPGVEMMYLTGSGTNDYDTNLSLKSQNVEKIRLASNGTSYITSPLGLGLTMGQDVNSHLLTVGTAGIQAQNYYSADNSVGMTGTVTIMDLGGAIHVLTFKNGMWTGYTIT